MTECEICGAQLSRGYPWHLCPSCWQEKYQAPPGFNQAEVEDL